MKKFLIAFLSILLGACDRPEVEVWLRPCCEMEDKFGMVKLSVWDDGRAVLNVHDADIILTQEEDDYYDKSSVRKRIEWRGKLPNEENDVFVKVIYDVDKQGFGYISISDSKDRSYGADMHVPVKLSKYKMPTDVELCIKEIEAKTYEIDGEIFFRRVREIRDYVGVIVSRRYYMEKIPADDAVAISENWDYKNLKLYSNYDDKGVEAHEKDACETLERLNAYIEKRGWDKPIIVDEDEIGCKKPQQVVYLGCDLSGSARFEYVTLYICEDGRHALDGVDLFKVPMSSENKLGGTLYSGTTDGNDYYGVMFKPSTDKWFARLTPHFDEYGECTVGRLAPHEVCARQIAKYIQVGSDGIIELEINITEKDGTLEREFVPLTQEQALIISKNWDYNNLKLYSTGQESHEFDACDALDRLTEMRFRLLDEKKDKK